MVLVFNYFFIKISEGLYDILMGNSAALNDHMGYWLFAAVNFQNTIYIITNPGFSAAVFNTLMKLYYILTPIVS